MDIIKAVKKLGNKLTGETYTSKDLVKLIDEIADDYSGGGGGGDNVMIVETVWDDELFGYVPQTSYADVFANIGSKEIILVCGNQQFMYSSLAYDTNYEETAVMVFTSNMYTFDTSTEMLIEIHNSSIFWAESYTYLTIANDIIWQTNG